ncbi:MoaD/ThiS family protein [Pelagerythrobacter marensis]|uniref:Molybdopterin synthase sulfur carrier subunit n=1 Tax=Pelagerythrobacter marensis TaxID=543877 RepID=A0A0G3X799_9SPHN|nr:MoaD/ThiS family protein [Pelagerythrobacter marensis]AKM07440.1 Molybdopterin synthase sulfur carrier subunit [Pelagerythrobacter marensis]
MKLVFLGKLADLAGRDEYDLAAAGRCDWQGLKAHVAVCGGDLLAEAVAADNVRVARNGTLLDDKSAIEAEDGDEIAFLPPVSGG